MSRLLEALKRLEPEMTATQPADPIALAESPSDSTPGASQTAIIEPAEEKQVLKYPFDDDLGRSPPIETRRIPAEEARAADHPSSEASEPECEIFQEVHADEFPPYDNYDNIESEGRAFEAAENIESRPFVEVSAEIDGLAQASR